MQLNLQTDFALRILIQLAVAGERRVTLPEVAASHSISLEHLRKVAQQLVHLGLVDARRGRSGGLVLARPAGEISVGEVVRGIEPDLCLVECMGPNPQCVLQHQCILKGHLARARRAFLRELDAVTLAACVVNRAALAELLGMAPDGGEIQANRCN